MIVTAKMTSKGQITIPKEIRNILEVGTGSMVVFEQNGEKIVVYPARTLKDYKGYLKGKGKEVKVDFDEVRRKAKEAVGRKIIGDGD